MTLKDFLRDAESLGRDAVAAAERADSIEALDVERARYLGRRNGALPALLKQLPTLSAADRRDAGEAANRAKIAAEDAFARRAQAVNRAGVLAESPRDPTMPARHVWRGTRHPVTVVIEEITEIFRELGFTVALGPEAESDWYNFTSLNFPAEHPAMDLHDTLYLADEVVLRTHTSPVQMRTLERHAPPIRVLIPGNAYRRDFFDASHAPMFAQIEGLAVDEGVSFVDLKATLTHFANRFFGPTRTRFRPSYFPFTEPSAEMDVECQLCSGKGCPGCKGTGWMEIMGSGMVHPAVLETAGLDSDRYSGWAFGMGPARIAMLRYGIPDIRLLYDSDVRFLQQFGQ